MATKAERGALYFERGTAPKGATRHNSGEGLAEAMEGRTDSARGYKAPDHGSPSAKRAAQGLSFRQMRAQRDWKKNLDGSQTHSFEQPRAERPQTENERRADEKRIDCPFTLTFRSIRAADFNFVLNAWMVSYQDALRGMRKDAYFHGQQNLIAELAKRRHMIIGCDAECPDWIAGFICGVPLEDGRLIVDYIYVKYPYRDRGIARGLLSAMGWLPGQEIIATHRGRSLEGAYLRYNASYNPFLNMIGYGEV